MDGASPSAPLERSLSQHSGTSSKSQRSTVRGSSRRKLVSQTSSSASSVDASDKSLTSFPSFSPGSPTEEADRNLLLPPDAFDGAAALLFKKKSTASPGFSASTSATAPSPAQASSSIVESLTGAADPSPNPSLISPLSAAPAPAGKTTSSTRSALFEDAPTINSSKIPGALHLADDEHVARLIAKHGAVGLVRQLAEDVALRDAQISALRTRAADRERALRKIIRECGLSNLELETRLRAVEQDARLNGKAVGDRRVSDLMSDAMTDSVSAGAYYEFPPPQSGMSGLDGQATIRAASGSLANSTTNGDNINNKGTLKYLKDYIWGSSTSRKTSRSSSINDDAGGKQQQPQQTVIRAPISGDRRPTLQDDLFSPPEGESVRSSSRASSIANGVPGGRKSSTTFSTLVRMVAGGGSVGAKDGDPRGRGSSSVAGGSLRTPSVSSQKTNGSARAVSVSGQTAGPKALMSMRRATAGGQISAAVMRSRPEERWDTMVPSPVSAAVSRQESYGPVEMDKILPLEGQPPTLAQFNYNHIDGSEDLTDRFGFIYDQRRKKRQRAGSAQLSLRQAHQVIGATGGGLAERILANGKQGKPIPAPIVTVVADGLGSTAKWDAGGSSEGRPLSPSSTEEGREEGSKSGSRWYDYLKVVTFQVGTERTTELLSDTPAISAPGIEVTVGGHTKSPAIVPSPEDRGFVPPASAATSALDTRDPIATASSSDVEATAGTFVKDDAEPVKQLLEQLNSVHDALQKKRMDRWNEFQRKVRAERRKDMKNSASNNMASSVGSSGDSGSAAGELAGADARRTIMPETKLTDGELIGVADLGNRGKVGRAKWSEFRSLVLGGIPVVLRAKVWAECSGALDMRIPGYYEGLVGGAEGRDGDNPDVVTQIRADINRTLTDNIFFRRGAGVAKLHEVLLAYSRRNPDVGYCQGMNLIAANLLLLTPSAEDAFWLLAAIVERILPTGYYDHSLLASRADQQVLRQFVAEVLPRLSAHFDGLGIDLETMTFQWFLSVFTDCLSAEALFRVWDVVLCLAPDGYGSTFMFQVALALLKLNEPQLLQCSTSAAVYTYINHQMTNHAISIDGLIQASEGLRRLVRREDVASRREAAVSAERELARLRDEQRSEAAAAARAKAEAAARKSRKATAADPVVISEDVLSPTASVVASAAASETSRSASPAPPPLPSPSLPLPQPGDDGVSREAGP